jgi:2-keto-4-pentenoate hydratase
MPLSQAERRAAADALIAAERDQKPIAPLTDTWPQIDIDDAYDIQLLVARDGATAGRKLRGLKVGLTAKTMQAMFGVDEPDYGHLFADMFVLEGGTIDTSVLTAPRVEVELAFVLEDRLEGPGVTAADVLLATAYVCPSLEIIDSRIADWKIKLQDTIADNGSSCRVVLGGSPATLDSVDPRLIGATLRVNGELVETGATGAVLGNPVNAVAWLANKLAPYGVALEAGYTILPGSCTKAINVAAGDSVRADFDGLGHVSVRFT